MVDRTLELIQMGQTIAIDFGTILAAELGDPLLGGGDPAACWHQTGPQLGGIKPEERRGDLALIVELLGQGEEHGRLA